MVDNEDFLMTTLKEQGTTHLRDIFLNYLKEKEQKHQESLVPTNVMMPQEMLNKHQPAQQSLQ